MVASAAASAFFPVVAASTQTNAKTTTMMLGGGTDNLDTRGINSSKSTSSGGLKVKVNAQAPPKINGYTAPAEIVKSGDETSSPPARTFINQLPDWSVLLTAITAMFLAAEKQWTLLDWKPRRDDMLVDPFGLGKIVQDGLVYRQNFSIRSYEIGADRTASIETLMNHLQETALNHVRTAGLLGDGFGSTPEMSRRNLLWVVSQMQVLVDRYPSWGDVVQVDTWVSACGKNCMRRNWLLRDSNTGETLTRATSKWVMMHKETRRLSKMPDEVRAEIEPYFMDCDPILEEDSRKLPKLDDDTADFIQAGLTPRWSDLDVNQHVNNVKYIGWILESAPSTILESHQLYSMTLEYRKECGKDSVLKSLTSVSGDASAGSSFLDVGDVECSHMLRLESGDEVVVKGRTEWRPKPVNNFGTPGQSPVQSL
ncbi:hypothetical protein MKW98_011238 [Papaver atlanticum]|uniref:Acyl-[acyl-carrier-protein] hydrolase n=1 Tax=Papaver atlanticum TaxID=357466 RepID=A0AAD4XL77_9MAGN|nr:hypothetical protein MKW98_011238 [Papaver atlanticum]